MTGPAAASSSNHASKPEGHMVLPATGACAGMDEQAARDVVMEAVVRLRSDIDALLCQHETDLQRSLTGPSTVQCFTVDAPTGHFENTKEDLSRLVPAEFSCKEGNFPPATKATMPVETADPGAVEDQHSRPGKFIQSRAHTGSGSLSEGSGAPLAARSEHWSRSLVQGRGSRVTRMLRKSWRSIRDCHRSMVGTLPVLVSKDSRLRKISKSGPYELFRTIVLIIDACVVIGELRHASAAARDADYVVQGGIPDYLPYLILTDFCCFVMTSDLLLMWTLEFPHVDFIRGRTKGRRWFNILVIIEQILQVISQHAIPGGRSMSMFRRVVSQLSVLRLIKAVAEVPEIAFRLELGIEEFRIIITSIMTSTMPFMMCAGLFMLFLTAAGVFLEEGVLAFLMNHNAPSHQALAELFGTFDVTVLTLFMGLFGGDDWGPMYQTLEPLPFYLRYGFLLFICFNFIAVFNIVAAAFIKVAFNRSESDRELLMQKERRSRKLYYDTMNKIFSGFADGEGNSKISREALEDHLKSPHIATYFSILGIDTHDVGKLVKLLDEDGSKDVSREEFIFGCMHLKGEARSLDLAFLQREVETMGRKVTDTYRRTRRSQNQGDVSTDTSQVRREISATESRPATAQR